VPESTPDEIEEWRPVVGYVGLYEVSSLGAVRTLPRKTANVRAGRNGRQAVRGRLLAPSGVRYLRVTLTKDGKPKGHHIHRLVLESFIGSCPAGMLARHFPSRNTKDNRLANLRWGTPEENQADRLFQGTSNRGKPNPQVEVAVAASASQRRSRLECKNGHPLDGDNLYLRPDGKPQRGCRVCRTAARHRYEQRQRGEQP